MVIPRQKQNYTASYYITFGHLGRRCGSKRGEVSELAKLTCHSRAVPRNAERNSYVIEESTEITRNNIPGMAINNNFGFEIEI